MAGVVAGAEAGFHRMSLKTQRGSSETKRDLKRVVVAGPTLVAATCHGAFGSTITREEKLRLTKAWKAGDLVKG
jgi:hypothetical protein